jgi:hypothetical protein
VHVAKDCGRARVRDNRQQGRLRDFILKNAKARNCTEEKEQQKTKTTQEAEGATGQLRAKKRSLYKGGKQSACLQTF